MAKDRGDGKAVDNVGAYIIRYMTKEYDDERLQGCKSYLASRGLKRPVTYTGEDALLVVQAMELDTKKETFSNSYEAEYLGKIVYKEYNLKRPKCVESKIS